jgi:hypothetical protein
VTIVKSKLVVYKSLNEEIFWSWVNGSHERLGHLRHLHHHRVHGDALQGLHLHVHGHQLDEGDGLRTGAHGTRLHWELRHLLVTDLLLLLLLELTGLGSHKHVTIWHLYKLLGHHLVGWSNHLHAWVLLHHGQHRGHLHLRHGSLDKVHPLLGDRLSDLDAFGGMGLGSDKSRVLRHL